MKKTASKNGKMTVTFELPAETAAAHAVVAGEFNGWSTTVTRMKRRKDGSFSATLRLDPGQRLRFRYLVDDERWENDWAADAYLPNPFGSDDSIVLT
jgi:1,4-alpha-glucan branching enzyme